MSDPSPQPLSTRPPAHPALLDRPWMDAFVLFALAAGIRMLYVTELQGDPFAHDLVSNSGRYDVEARRIVEGARLAVSSGFQPLYPYVVAAVYKVFGPSPLAVRLLQVALAGLTAALLGVFARTLAGRAAGLLAGLAWALFWPAMLYAGELLPDTVFCALFAIALVTLYRAVSRGGTPWWLAGAACLAVASLAKPNTLVLTPWPLLAVLSWPGLGRGARTRRAVAALVVPAAVLGALALGPRLVEVDSSTATVAFAAKSLWDGNNRDSDGINPFQAEYPESMQWEVWDDPEDTAAVADRFRSEIVDFATSDPVGFAGLQCRKALIYLSTWEVANNLTPSYRRSRSRVLSCPLWLGFGALLALGCAGAASVRARWREHVLPLGWAITWSASIIGIVIAGRHRMAAAQVLAVYGAIGVVTLVAAWRAGRRRRLAALLGVLGVAVCVGTVDWLGLRHYRIASILQMEAQVLERAGDVEGAEARYLAGIDLRRHGANLQRSYGLFLIRQQRTDEGLATMAAAAARDPDNGSLAKDLGGRLRDLGMPAEALPYLQRAVTLEPDDPGIRYNLGLVLMDLGQLDEADAALTEALRRGGEPVAVCADRGVVRARLGRWEGAEQDLQIAAGVADGCGAVANLGLVYERTDRPDLATATYARCPDDLTCRQRSERLAASPVDEVPP